MPEPQPSVVSNHQFLEPRSSCSSCIDTLDDMEWVASATLQIGKWTLGVRSSSVEMDEALRRVLGAHLVDIEAPPNFSALMADGETRRFNFLYRASDFLVRSRVPGRVLRTLISHLSEFVEYSSPPVRMNATGLIVAGKAIVAPDELRAEIANIETRLNVAGLQVIDAPILHLDLDTGSVIVPESALTVDTEALADFEREHPPLGRELAPVLPGRYPIMGWALVTGEDRLGPVGHAQGVAAAARQVINADEIGAQQTLDVVAAALADVPISGIWWHDGGELVNQLRALANGTLS
jgi:hypothetical protein